MKDIINLSLEFLDQEKALSLLDGALLGGSWARNEASKNSDVDLLLICKDKYFKKYRIIHSREVSFKKYSFSIIYQSSKSINSYLKDPDPSVISFLREGVIIYDPNCNLRKWKKEAGSLKIFENKKLETESKRRLKERIDYNVGKIQEALDKNDLFVATYLLRGIVDEVVEKKRMYEEDWLYSQRKSNIRFLRKNNNNIKKLFYLVNKTLPYQTILETLTKLSKIKIV